MTRLPLIKDLAELIRSIKPQIDKDCSAYEFSEPDDVPSILLTIGWSDETGGWSYQTGDNSCTGGAYFYPHWATVAVCRRADASP
jgi:hypothetical protein